MQRDKIQMEFCVFVLKKGVAIAPLAPPVPMTLHSVVLFSLVMYTAEWGVEMLEPGYK